MATSDDARQAITSLAAATPYPMAKDRPQWVARMALLAVMPDGRTIAQHLDDGGVALGVLARMTYRVDDGWQFGGYITDEHEAADLLARLEATNG